MRREWSFHRPRRSGKQVVWLVLAGIVLFVLGFFAARPLMMLFGLI